MFSIWNATDNEQISLNTWWCCTDDRAALFVAGTIWTMPWTVWARTGTVAWLDSQMMRAVGGLVSSPVSWLGAEWSMTRDTMHLSVTAPTRTAEHPESWYVGQWVRARGLNMPFKLFVCACVCSLLVYFASLSVSLVCHTHTAMANALHKLTWAEAVFAMLALEINMLDGFTARIKAFFQGLICFKCCWFCN